MTTPYPRTLPRFPLEDGRLGSGPAKIRREQLDRFVADPDGVLGTSHRKEPVKRLVGRIQRGLLELFGAPAGYEIVLGNGGSTAFWDIAAASLIEQRAQCLDFGVFGNRMARAAAAPWLATPDVRTAPHGELVLAEHAPDIDTYAWAHNETSTGVVAPVWRVGQADGAITLIDGTSAAGGIGFDAANADVYYFAPQKNLGSDGGLWVALVSPAAAARAERIAASGRFIPEFLNLHLAIEQSRKQQTLNTPAIATLMLLDSQLEWLLAQGGLGWAASHTRSLATKIYDWADQCEHAFPFVANPALRSPTNAVIEFDRRVDVKAMSAMLRSCGIVDIDGYSGVGQNQLRIGTYVSVTETDIDQLLRNFDVLVPHLLAGSEATAAR
ncbi:phosphoserine transaminase [Nonlabens tegetincola]